MTTTRLVTTFALLSACSPLFADAPPAVAEAEKKKAAAEAAASPAAPELSAEEIKSNSSYGFGYRNGLQFSQQTTRFGLTAEDIDQDAFIRGFFQAFNGEDSTLAEPEVNAALRALQARIQEREKALGEENLAAGKKFLEENAKRDGVITTESGLQYEILEKGDGETYQKPEGSGPDRTQFVVEYKGSLIDGTEFDSSKGQSVPMGVNTVPGFREALTTMPVGSTWKLYLKPELAYGDQRRSREIGPNSTLVFELTLSEIKTPPAPPAGAAPGQRPTAVSPPIRVPLPPKKEEGAAEATGDGSEDTAPEEPEKTE